jgi:hypothetical protein
MYLLLNFLILRAMIRTYDTTFTSFLINYYAISHFCQHKMHDTTYDASIVDSLRTSLATVWNSVVEKYINT